MGGRRSSSPALLVGALGVVFGDIGTSPLYAFRAVLKEGNPADPMIVLGMTSLMIWALLIVVTVLYVVLLLRTDNDGEGGLLALLALLRRSGLRGRSLAVISIVGMAGAAMFLGDSVITPAISVLSAAEGLTVADPSLGHLVVPIALVVLAGVFILQRVGTGTIGRFYGPVMCGWFGILAVGGAFALVGNPGAVRAISPSWAVRFAMADPATAFVCLGSVVLVVTGAEALYADLGHFGASAIRRAWFFVVLPALLLAYLGECAKVLRDPGQAANPFYAVVPGWATIPVLVVATLATIIASEAVIAGTFTVVHQSGGLEILPYLQTRHTSERQAGQIYLPAVNWSLAVAVLAVVATFGSSEKLSSAYGVAVSVTILVTVTLFLVLDRVGAGRFTARQMLAGIIWLIVVLFVASAMLKLRTGGWLPVAIGLVMFATMTTWWSGRRRLRSAVRRQEETSALELLREVDARPDAELHRVPGSGVFLTEHSDVAPAALRVMVERMHVLPERVVLLSWRIEDTPAAPARDAAVTVDRFDDRHSGVVGVDVVLGYQERLEVQHVLRQACDQEPGVLSDLDPDEATYFVSDPIPRLSRDGGMARWRQRLFLLLDRMTTDRVEQLRLPRARSTVIGRQVDL